MSYIIGLICYGIGAVLVVVALGHPKAAALLPGYSHRKLKIALVALLWPFLLLLAPLLVVSSVIWMFVLAATKGNES